MESETLGGAAVVSAETGRKSRSGRLGPETQGTFANGASRASCMAVQRGPTEKDGGDATSPTAGPSSLGSSWPSSWDNAPESQRDKIERIAMRRKRAEAKLLQARGT